MVAPNREGRFKMNRSVTIIIPAYNEEGNIEGALESVVRAVSGLTPDYEIIVVDDGSRDRTAFLTGEKAKRNPQIKIVSNGENKGYGFAFRRGVSLAEKAYVTVFPGDNDMSADSLRDLIQAAGRVDVVTTHVRPNHNRSRLRRFLSRTFVRLMNFLFGLDLKYYTGAFICQTHCLRSITIKSDSLAVLAECMVRLIKSGYSYTSIPFVHTGRKSERSKALRLKSIWAVIRMISVLAYDVHFTPQYKQKRLCSI